MMIKLLFLLFFFIVILSCSSAKKSTQNNDVKINLTDEDRNGIEFIKKEDCFTCHSIDRALVGPSFHDIAGKYEPIERNLMRLSKKIIEGGNGNWGKLF